MNNKKHILNLDQFRDILQICPKVGNKKFEEPPLEKEILAFLASLGHSGEIRKITDVNVNKLHQPWRSFAAIINKYLSIPRRNKVNSHYARDDPMFTTINVISRNKDTQLKDSKTHKQSASQSVPVEETMKSTDVFEAPVDQEFETGVHDEQPKEEVHPIPDWFQQPKRLPSPDRA
ncbi:hypothetical protein Tco_1181760 [Tanacetum coccineum]